MTRFWRDLTLTWILCLVFLVLYGATILCGDGSWIPPSICKPHQATQAREGTPIKIQTLDSKVVVTEPYANTGYYPVQFPKMDYVNDPGLGERVGPPPGWKPWQGGADQPRAGDVPGKMEPVKDKVAPLSAMETALLSTRFHLCVDAAVRIEFLNASEQNSKADQDKRRYSGLARLYDKDDKPMGRWRLWDVTVRREKGIWTTTDEDFSSPEPTPIKPN